MPIQGKPAADLAWSESAARLLAAQPPAWQGNLDVSHPCVVMTRLVTYRNFSGFPFTVSAPPNLCAAVADKALHLLAKRGGQTIWRLSDCPPQAVRLLRERHLLPERSVPFPGKKESKYLAVGPGAKTWALVNEVEHVTFGQVFPGRLAASDFTSVYLPPEETVAEEMRSGPDGDGREQRIPWSWSTKLGYLTSRPERIGPAMEVEMLVHLPGMALAHKLPQARNAMAALGVGSLPISPMGTGESESSLFLLKSRGGAGKSVSRVYAEFLGSVQPLLDWERNLQLRCLEKHHKRLEVRVRDSLRKLSQSQVLSYPELLAATSWLRLGAYLGLLPPGIITIVEELRVVAGSGHLGVSCGRSMTKEEEDIQRANGVRLALETHHV